MKSKSCPSAESATLSEKSSQVRSASRAAPGERHMTVSGQSSLRARTRPSGAMSWTMINCGFWATSRSLPDSDTAWSSTTPMWFVILRPENQISFDTGFQAIEEMISQSDVRILDLPARSTTPTA
jgi:hypothetical protein